MANQIILYDIPSKLTPMAWSPNTWKARYVLNYKGLPYETVWISYTDIAGLWEKLGLKPITDGSNIASTFLPVVSVPSKEEGKPPTIVADSFNIALFLDKRFPETPRVIPPDTAGLQSSFIQTLTLTVFVPLRPIAIPQVPSILVLPKESEYYTRTREKTFSSNAGGGEGGRRLRLEEVSPKGSEKRKADLESVRRGLATMSRILHANRKQVESDEDDEKKNKEGEDEVGWVMGSVGPTFADFALGAVFRWVYRVDETMKEGGEVGKEGEGELWKMIEGCEQGKWVRYAERFKQWEQIL
ncbi:hypothetical protein FRC17_006226 [Serendipita sp. 399]|nr:hypothetical protein FRC17_006226 [Serendipita sp. 399]